MKTKILTAEFYNYLKMIVEHHKLEPKNTYVEITWWNNVFRPLITTDCDRSRDSKYIMVFGNTPCNIYGKNENNEVIPTGFWIYNDAYCVEQVNDKIHLRYKYNDNKLFSIMGDKPQWDTYGIASSVESFFSQEEYPFHFCVSMYTAIREISEDFEHSRITANYLNKAAFNFLKVVHQSNSIEELGLKLQLMGY